MNTRARWIRIVLAVLALVAIAVPAATSAAPKKRGQGKGQDAHPRAAKKPLVVDGHPEEGFFVFDFTLAELKTLRAIQTRGRNDEFDGQFEIPTLQEVITLAKRSSQRLHRQIGIYPETKHPTLHQGLGLALERPLVRMLRRNGLDRKRAPVFIQSFEQANLEQLNTMTKVKLVQLVDAWDLNPD